MTTSGTRCGLAGFAAKVAEYGVAEEGVGAGLVALALAAKATTSASSRMQAQLALRYVR